MPYANGPVHLGHLAGAQVPADIYARWMGLLIGREHVLYVNGTDDHGSASEVAAIKEGVSIREFIDRTHESQRRTLERYRIGVDVYSGTSRPECFAFHKENCQDFLRKLHANGLLEKRASKQWYDPKMQRFLPDRMVRGTCPNPKCNDPNAYSDECDRCGHQHEPSQLINPRSTLTDATPRCATRSTGTWTCGRSRRRCGSGSRGRRRPGGRPSSPTPWTRCSPRCAWTALTRIATRPEGDPAGPQEQVRAGQEGGAAVRNKADLSTAREALAAQNIASAIADEWAHRSITRDIAWGVPVPDIDPELAGKTLYVWPDSLIAPISFSQVAPEDKGLDPATARRVLARSPGAGGAVPGAGQRLLLRADAGGDVAGHASAIPTACPCRASCS
jgi:methionyl-tRNA synthetase